MFLDSDKFDGHILRADSDNRTDLVIAERFKPQQDDTPVHETELADPVVELADLLRIRIGILVRVDIDTQRHPLSGTFLFSVGIKAGIQRNTVDPRLGAAVPLERGKTFPEFDQNILEQVIDLIIVLRKHVADRVDGCFVFMDESCEFQFLCVHRCFRIVSSFRRREGKKTTPDLQKIIK